MNDLDERDELLSPTEAARRLDINPKTLKRWANDGRIAYVRLPNGYLKFRADDVAAVRETVKPAPMYAPVEDGGDR